jgi:hypothetical protein
LIAGGGILGSHLQEPEYNFLRLLEDCQKVLGVDIAFDSKAERTKILTYL